MTREKWGIAGSNVGFMWKGGNDVSINIVVEWAF
jgi:hypothetical protein